MPAELVIDPIALAELLRGPEGPVMRHTIVVAEAVKQTAIADLTPGFPADFLGPTIVKRVLADTTVQVGTDRTRTDSHPIDKKPGFLRFPDSRTGAIVYTHHVDHLGSNFTNPTEKHPHEGGYIGEVLHRALTAVWGTI